MPVCVQRSCSLARVVMSAAIGSMLLSGIALAKPATPDERTRELVRWSDDVWRSAEQGTDEAVARMLSVAPFEPEADAERTVFSSTGRLNQHLLGRETRRESDLAEARVELTEHLTKANEAVDPALEISEAVRVAVRIQVLMDNQDAFFADTRIQELERRAEQEAAKAEQAGDWLMAGELYARLGALHDISRKYQADIDRINERLRMVRLYNPQRLWDLRDARRKLEELPPLPAYNSTGDTWQEKVRGISERMVRDAIRGADRFHVADVDLRTIILGGLHALEILATTKDLEAAFPGLRDEAQRARFLAEVRRQMDTISTARTIGQIDVITTMDRMRRLAKNTIGVDDAVVMREFGNGAMTELDQFSQIIWPDEVDQFNRLTSGRFVGVGISIQMDEQQNIKVVTPLVGTPAQRAGIQSDDLIKGVNGEATVGFTLDQAVDLITGDPGTSVTLTIERTEKDGAGEEVTRQFDLTIKRERIELVSIKGWERNGPAEDDWDWFVDRPGGIGYVRVTSFSSNTTSEFDAAVREMRDEGLNALIVDLRHNPGGLLDQAVSMASRFITDGLVVSTETGDGQVFARDEAVPGLTSRQRVTDIPVIVLVNEGSASASEILSGAIQDYAREGGIDAIILGQRTFGKGSVQNVVNLSSISKMKLTTFYYRLRGGRLIHRQPDSTQWGVQPDLTVEMLPSQVADSLIMRRDADVIRFGAGGAIIDEGEDAVDPNKLIDEGIDLQLTSAVAILQSRVLAGTSQARASSRD